MKPEGVPNKKAYPSRESLKVPNRAWYTSDEIETFLEGRDMDPNKLQSIRVKLTRDADNKGKLNPAFINEILGEQLARDFEKFIAEGRL